MGCFSVSTPLTPTGDITHEKQPTPHPTVKPCKLRKKAQVSAQRERQKRKQQIAAQKRSDTALIYEMYTTIRHHFPALFTQMRAIDEVRTNASDYELVAHLTACLALFLFKLGSRNQWNQKRKKPQFQSNYEKLFGFAMPHGDSMNAVIDRLDEDQVEWLKQQMVRTLLQRKVFRSSRYRGKWYCIAIDGSGVASFDHEHCEQCLHKTSKKGKTTWSHQVLDARLVTPNGFSVSIATVWIENPDGKDYDKQDCERKAFQRLASKLHKAFPRLPIQILADGLYPYEGFFQTCRDYGWEFSTTFKDGNLPSIWEEVEALKLLQSDQQRTDTHYQPLPDGQITTYCEYQWVTGLDYQGHTLYWVHNQETTVRQHHHQAEGVITLKYEQNDFIHITSLPVSQKNVASTSQTARLRWKVENEGFNTLKNGGYGMEHKWARKSYRALKNYYQFMQMAHLIHQLMLKRQTFVETWLQGSNHPTVKSLWEDLLGAMQWSKVKYKKLRKILAVPIQFRLIT